MRLVEVHANTARVRQRLYLVSMSLHIVLVRLALFFVSGGFVRSVAERLVLGQATHANPDRLCLRFNLEGSHVRFQYFAHARNLRCHLIV